MKASDQRDEPRRRDRPTRVQREGHACQQGRVRLEAVGAIEDGARFRVDLRAGDKEAGVEVERDGLDGAQVVVGLRINGLVVGQEECVDGVADLGGQVEEGEGSEGGGRHCGRWVSRALREYRREGSIGSC